MGLVVSQARPLLEEWNETCYSTCPDPFLPPRSGKGSAKVWLARLWDWLDQYIDNNCVVLIYLVFYFPHPVNCKNAILD